MKTIGLLGGMSWESTALYYRLINEQIKARLGGLHSARLVLLSVDFQGIETLQQKGDWQAAGEILGSDARLIAAAGADFLVICTNTMHRVASQIEAAAQLPLLHIADATAQHIKKQGFHKVGLLGTRYTMEDDFYAGRLRDMHNLMVLVPDHDARNIVHQIIFEELVLGLVRAESRQKFMKIIEDLRAEGAEAVIAGCTEIGMLVRQEHTTLPLYDTTAIHAEAAVNLALAG